MALIRPSKYDLFVSYSRADNQQTQIDWGDEKIGWVDAFVRRLTASHRKFSGEDLKTFFDRQSIESDTDWLREIRHGLRDSKFFLAFLSPRYLDSRYCQLEWEEYVRFQHSQARGEDGIRHIYVATLDMLENPNIPPPAEREEMIRQLRAIQIGDGVDIRDLRDDLGALESVLRREETAARAAELKFSLLQDRIETLGLSIGERLDRVRLAEMADAHTNMPLVYRTFVGRTDELTKVHQAATGSTVGQRLGVIGTLNGLGGQGKTALAVQYSHAFAGFYAAGGRWFLKCEGKRSLLEAFDDLPAIAGYKLSAEEEKIVDAGRLGIHLNHLKALMDQQSKKLAEVWGKAYGRPFPTSKDGPRALVVLDNVDHPGLLNAADLGRLNGLGKWLSLLATTRLDPGSVGDVGRMTVIPVDDLPMNDRLSLLREFAPLSAKDEGAARDLLKMIGGVTLLVEIIAATLAVDLEPGEPINPHQIAELTQKLARSGVFHLDGADDEAKARLNVESERQKRLDLIVEDTLASLATQVPAARAVLEAATAFPADVVTLDWLREIAMQDESTLADNATWRRVVRRLNGRRLLIENQTQEGHPATARLHRDIAAHLRRGMAVRNKVMTKRLETVVAKMSGEIERLWQSDPATLKWHGSLMITAEHLDAIQSNLTTAKALSLSATIEGKYGDTDRSIELLEASLKASSDYLRGNPASLEAMRNLRATQEKLSQFYLSRAKEGDAERAHDLLIDLVESSKSILQSDLKSLEAMSHLSVSQTLLGDFFLSRGEAESALSLYTESLAICEAILTSIPGSAEAIRDVAVLQNKLGDVLQSLGQAPLAMERYLVSLEANEALLYANPGSAVAMRDVSVLQEKLGDIYRSRGGDGDAERALSLYASSLETCEAILTANPGSAVAMRDVSVSQEKLGDLYLSRGGDGDAARAQSLYTASLETREAILTANPGSAALMRDVSVSQNKLGDLYLSRGGDGDAERALWLYTASLETCEAILTANPGSAAAMRDVSVSQNKLGDLYLSRGGDGDAERALSLYTASLETCEAILTANPGSAAAMRDVIVSVVKLGQASADGRGVFRRALDMLDAMDAAGMSMDGQMRSIHAQLRQMFGGETAVQMVRIGITGHRWNKIPRSLAPDLAALMAEVLGQAESQLQGRKVLTCGMAEGTDLTAALARPEGWALEAVLPLPPAEWRQHLAETSGDADATAFDRALAGAEVRVLPHPEGPDYEALGRYIADTSDILIAVWDEATPKPGGTGEVVSRARVRGIPVLVLPPPGSDQPG